jgi:hypothetical protein
MKPAPPRCRLLPMCWQHRRGIDFIDKYRFVTSLIMIMHSVIGILSEAFGHIINMKSSIKMGECYGR